MFIAARAASPARAPQERQVFFRLDSTGEPGQSRIHAAPTEPGRAGRLFTIHMALLTELNRSASPKCVIQTRLPPPLSVHCAWP